MSLTKIENIAKLHFNSKKKKMKQKKEKKKKGEKSIFKSEETFYLQMKLPNIRLFYLKPFKPISDSNKSKCLILFIFESEDI